MQGAIPHPKVASRLADQFVGLAADADADDSRVLALAMQIEDAAMLPFVIFTDDQGNFRTGYAGSGTVPRMLRALDDLEVPVD
ncbi:MAG TPA: hypothetical protein EYQ25_08320 [Planctomycetes bacterium]|nr:hypothetical protein [Planctomycetota bacterium]HIL38386.1 hypothetical protein [Planctomycetota bacterium]